MKKKDLNDLKNKSEVELEKMVVDLSLQIGKAKMDLKMHRAKNTNGAKNLKKTLAQVLTIKNLKQLNTKTK